MVKRYGYLFAVVACFVGGAYIWKVFHTGRTPSLTGGVAAKGAGESFIIQIGSKLVSSEDLDFEYSLHTQGVFDSEALTPIPDLGNHYEKELATLRERLFRNIVERKMLFAYIEQDESFDLEDNKRLGSCLAKWQETIAQGKDLYPDAASQERLKNRLCESSIVSQYLKERILPKVTLSEPEIETYYNGHKPEFSQPDKVVIRQIVFATEDQAKEVKKTLNAANFAALAKEHSITPEAEDGGKLGPFAQGEMPPFFDVAFSMRPYEIRGILMSTYGFHVIMLEKKVKAVKLTLQEAEPKIREQLLAKKKNEEYQKWVDLALNTVPINSTRH